MACVSGWFVVDVLTQTFPVGRGWAGAELSNEYMIEYISSTLYTVSRHSLMTRDS